MQVIDVRDLAAWVVTCAEQRTQGTFDGVGPAMPVEDVLAETARGVEATTVPTWVPDATLTELGVEPWMGEAALPLWLPRPDYDGMLSHDATPSYAAGLTTRLSPRPRATPWPGPGTTPTQRAPASPASTRRGY